jgi:hypothetical protein
MRAEPRKLRGLASKGQSAKIKAEKAEKYEPRVDMYGAISYNGPLCLETKTSGQRKNSKQKNSKKRCSRLYKTYGKGFS